MLKWIGCILLIAAGAGTGYLQSHKLTARVRFLEAFLQFLTWLETQIRYSASELEALLAGYEAPLTLQPLLTECAGRMGQDEPFSQAWDQGVALLPKESGLLPGDRQLLCQFAEGLGSTDVQGQITHCAMQRAFFTNRLEEARDERQKKGKLYTMLGSFAGVGVSLLFL